MQIATIPSSMARWMHDLTTLYPAFYRVHDWSSTPLGDPDTWDKSLRETLYFMLTAVRPAFMLWGPQGIMLYNEAYYGLLSTDAPQSLGQPASEVLRIWDVVRGEMEPILDAVSSGRSGMFEEVPLRTHASDWLATRYYTFSYVPLLASSGELVGGMCFVEDRTDEVTLRHSLSYERDRLRELFEQAPGCIAMMEGPEHRFVLANAAVRNLLGQQEMIGRTAVESVPDAFEQGFGEIFDRVYATGEHFIGAEMPLNIRPDGLSAAVTRYVDTVIQPVREADGRIIGVFAEGYDVTERRADRQHIESLQTELIHLSRVSAMNTMGSALAHELNQPLASVSNYLAAGRRLAERNHCHPDIVHCLERASSEARRAGDIIRKLRDLTVRGGASKSDVPLAATIREAVKFGLTGAVNVTVDYDLGGVRTVAADAIQLQQVLINLVRNSCDAAFDQPLRITISAAQSNGLVEISVKDDGPGIDPEILATMFDSFISAKPDGMGIGLSICRTIVESHGGHITAHNNPDRGATLQFTLPVEA